MIPIVVYYLEGKTKYPNLSHDLAHLVYTFALIKQSQKHIIDVYLQKHLTICVGNENISLPLQQLSNQYGRR